MIKKLKLKFDKKMHAKYEIVFKRTLLTVLLSRVINRPFIEEFCLIDAKDVWDELIKFLNKLPEKKQEFENLCVNFGRTSQGKCYIDEKECRFQYKETEKCCEYSYQKSLLYQDEINPDCIYYTNGNGICAKNLTEPCQFQYKETDLDCSRAWQKNKI